MFSKLYSPKPSKKKNMFSKLLFSKTVEKKIRHPGGRSDMKLQSTTAVDTLIFRLPSSTFRPVTESGDQYQTAQNLQSDNVREKESFLRK